MGKQVHAQLGSITPAENGGSFLGEPGKQARLALQQARRSPRGRLLGLGSQHPTPMPKVLPKRRTSGKYTHSFSFSADWQTVSGAGKKGRLGDPPPDDGGCPMAGGPRLRRIADR